MPQRTACQVKQRGHGHVEVHPHCADEAVSSGLGWKAEWSCSVGGKLATQHLFGLYSGRRTQGRFISKCLRCNNQVCPVSHASRKVYEKQNSYKYTVIVSRRDAFLIMPDVYTGCSSEFYWHTLNNKLFRTNLSETFQYFHLDVNLHVGITAHLKEHLIQWFYSEHNNTMYIYISYIVSKPLISTSLRDAGVK